MRASFYFETSAVNFLYDLFSQEDKFSSVETKKFQISKGRKWYISCVTLWEIFRTKDKKLRHDIFDFCRSLFYDHLIACPEEIILNFIKSNCPVLEKPYNLNSSNSELFAVEWHRACKDKNFFFEPDRQQLDSYTESMLFIGKYLYRKQNGYELKTSQELMDQSYHLLGIRLENLLSKLLGEFEKATDEIKRFVSIVFHLALIIICYGITLNNQIFEHFWSSMKISRPLQRIEWLVEEKRSLFLRGPLANIAKMMILQADSKYSRGIFFDSLHSLYITYTDLYITSDNHFVDFKNKINDPNILKIIHVKDITFYTPIIFSHS